MRPNLHRTQSGKTIPRATGTVYTERSRFPKWNIVPTATQEPRLLKRRLPDWTTQDHIDAALWNARMALRLHNAWGKSVAAGIKKYGEHGALISGGFHDDWPESVKDKIRKLAHTTNAFVDVARAHGAQVRGLKERLRGHGLFDFAEGKFQWKSRSKRNSRRRR